jgi:bifunctional non-homologous end joining protein LigD
MLARVTEAVDERVVGRGRRRVHLTHLRRVLWPEASLTKADLLDYYSAIAPVILPHLRDVPFTIKRHYTVPRGPFEWVKDAPPEMPEWIKTCRLPAKSRQGAIVAYPLVNDELALLWMVEYGAVDLHVWCSRCDRPSRPQYVLFDLDPSPDVGFPETVRAAFLVRDALSALGLESYAKTSGATGLHVQVPVARTVTYEETRRFCAVVADALERVHPRLITTQRALRGRRGVFVDAQMNGEGMTIASAYSVRPQPGAPVSTPLAWEELHEGLDPRAFTMAEVLRRVEEHGDLWAPMLRGRRRLDTALRRLG